MSKISIIVPVYNCEQYLVRCIKSLISQSFREIDIILVDDGSTDSSGKICDDMAQKDDRIKVFHQINKGQAMARNYALDWVERYSDANWVTFVDSDDWIHPQMIETMYALATSNGVKIAACQFKVTHGENLPMMEDEKQSVVTDMEIFYCNNELLAVVPWGKLYHIDYIRGIRFPDYRYNEDEFFTYKVLFKSKEIAVTNEALYAYYVSTDSVMRSGWDSRRMCGFQAIREQERFFKENGYVNAYNSRISSYLFQYHDLSKRLQTEKSIFTRIRYQSSMVWILFDACIRHKNYLFKKKVLNRKGCYEY